MTSPTPLPTAWRELVSHEPGLTVEFAKPLARYTTFRIGGPAEVFARVDSERALRGLLAFCRRREVSLFLLGLGSNVLVPESGLAGVVLRLSGGFRRYQVRGSRVRAGAAMPLGRLAKRTAAAGLSGLEALSGFPSTVGGAVVMNAGSYGVEIRDILLGVTVVDREGGRRRLSAEDLEPGYRTTNLQGGDEIVTSAIFQLRAGDPERVMATIGELAARRRRSLPGGYGSAGSVFRNPPGDHAGRLIEDSGLKGLRHGKAQISERHANVIVNLGGATAEDVLALMVECHRRVRAAEGVDLEPEIVLTGDLRRRWITAVGLPRL